MPTIHLRIQPDLCGPVSVGTVGVIRLLSAHLGLSLADALAIVNRCVFDGECVAIPAPSTDVAERFAREALALRTPAKIGVLLEA